MENEDLDVRWLLLIHVAMRRGVVVDPVFLFIGHAVATGHLAGGTGFVVVAGQRPVTEGFCPVSPPLGIPLVDDHFYSHCATPNTAIAFGIVGRCGEPSVPRSR